MLAEQGRNIGLTRKEQNLIRFTNSRFLRIFFAANAAAASYSIYENVPAIHEAVDSLFLSHFRGDLLSPSEASTVNPEEVFDNGAEKGIISERNTVPMSLEDYKKIAPPPLNTKTPEQINILFPIQFPNGLDDRKIDIQKRGDWMGGGKRHRLGPDTDGSNHSNQRNTASKIDSVFKNSLTIKDGLREGDVLVSPASGMIAGLTIKDQEGNEYTIMMGGKFDLIPIKTIPPSITEKVILDNGTTGFRTITFPVPINEGEPIGIITKPSKGPLGMGGAGGTGQFQLITFSTVAIEDGTKQQGAATIVLNTNSDGKLIYITQ